MRMVAVLLWAVCWLIVIALVYAIVGMADIGGL
jgi:hypothetical protein